VKPYVIPSPNGSPLRLPQIRGNRQEDNCLKVYNQDSKPLSNDSTLDNFS
jgi:hypothetical protein